MFVVCTACNINYPDGLTTNSKNIVLIVFCPLVPQNNPEINEQIKKKKTVVS